MRNLPRGETTIVGNDCRAKTGDDGISISGNFGVSLTGDRGKASSGNCGWSEAGHDGVSISEELGTSIVGDRGIATAGLYGKAKGGPGSKIRIAWFHDESMTRRYTVGYVGVDGLQPDIYYCASSHDGELRMVTNLMPEPPTS